MSTILNDITRANCYLANWAYVLILELLTNLKTKTDLDTSMIIGTKMPAKISSAIQLLIFNKTTFQIGNQGPTCNAAGATNMKVLVPN